MCEALVVAAQTGEHTAMRPATFSYTTAIERHLSDVFSETDDTRRLNALHELYTPDAILFEPDNIVRGVEAISATVSALLKTLPAGLRFTAAGPALTHHDVCCAPWAAGTPQQPNMITGYDVVHFEGERISAVYVFINPSA